MNVADKGLEGVVNKYWDDRGTDYLNRNEKKHIVIDKAELRKFGKEARDLTLLEKASTEKPEVVGFDYTTLWEPDVKSMLWKMKEKHYLKLTYADGDIVEVDLTPTFNYNTKPSLLHRLTGFLEKTQVVKNFKEGKK